MAQEIHKSFYYQYLISIATVLISSLFCFIAISFIGYKTVALILLVNVSILAMVFDILPVLIACILSALIWNYFFIPPILTLHIDNTEDLLMFLMYFFIASVHAVLTFKIRKQEAKVRDKEEKEKSIKLYNTLLNSLSHELRTPISAIIGSVDILKEHKEKLSTENQIELLNQISIASLKLNTHVENLLNMSRLETGMLKLNLDWCDTNELIQSVIENLDILYTQHIVFEPNDSLPFFKLDRGLMEQVIFNLLANAIAYTPEDSEIKIEIERQEENCKLVVSDNGKGIPPAELNHLFDKFYRAEGANAGGLGIGLSIVRGIIDAHGGTILVENNLQGGLCFIILFPAEASYLNHLKNE
jgi:two-component system sensor histidine kinase KdpD